MTICFFSIFLALVAAATVLGATTSDSDSPDYSDYESYSPTFDDGFADDGPRWMDADEGTDVTISSCTAFDDREDECGVGGCGCDKTRDESRLPANRWSCAQELSDSDLPCEICYTFGEPQDIEWVRIAFYKGTQRQRSFNVTVTGEVDAETAHQSSGQSNTLGFYTIQTEGTEELCIESTGLEAEEWFSVLEVEFWVPEVEE